MKGILTVSRSLVFAGLICILAAFCVVPVWAGDITVFRTINPTSVPVGGEVLVTLSIDGMDSGGIVETIPEGFLFIETSCPADNYRISGHKLTFAVIGESEITYRVRAEVAGSWTFTGTWNDVVSKNEGTIPPTTVNVGSGSAVGAATAGNAQAEPSPTNAGGRQWAWIVLTLAAVVIVAVGNRR